MGALGKVSATPPDPHILPSKCLSGHHSSGGGVLRTKPPAGWLAHIEELRHLPADILMGLQALRDEPAPNITRPEAWDEIVADAVTLAVDGWARRALALGWDPLELFGCAPDPEGDDDRLGVAASLCGRQVLRLTLDAAHVTDGSTRWRLIRRDHLDPDMVYLWEYGR